MKSMVANFYDCSNYKHLAIFYQYTRTVTVSLQVTAIVKRRSVLFWSSALSKIPKQCRPHEL
jgi:hypothetical protein